MQPGSDPGDPDVRRAFGERRHQLVAAPPVAQPHRADMPVVRPGGDELGERQLLQRTRHPVGVPLRRDDIRHQAPGQHQPADPQPGGDGFAGGAEVDDPFGIESLERTDRLPVVAELPVVVVLQDQPARGPRPVDGGRPPVGVERHPQRELVRRRQQHRTFAPQRTGLRAECVQRESGGAQPRVGEQVPVQVQPVRLDRHLPHPSPPQHLPHQHQTVCEPRADDDPVRVGVHPAGPCQIVGQHGPQLGPPTRVPVSERFVGSGGQRLPCGPEPLGAREGREVGRAGQQAVRGAPRLRRPYGDGRGRRTRYGPGCHPGPRALPRGQPAFRHQFGVGVGHRVPGDSQVGGEGARGRQPGPRRQPPRAHGLAQRVREPHPQPGTGQLQVQVHTESGPGIRHGNGPYPCATHHVASSP